jgi:hypothetical protein
MCTSCASSSTAIWPVTLVHSQISKILTRRLVPPLLQDRLHAKHHPFRRVSHGVDVCSEAPARPDYWAINCHCNLRRSCAARISLAQSPVFYLAMLPSMAKAPDLTASWPRRHLCRNCTRTSRHTTNET